MYNDQDNLKNKLNKFSEALGQIIDDYHGKMEESRNEIQDIHREHGLDLICDDIAALDRAMEEVSSKPAVREMKPSTSSNNSKVGVKSVEVKVVPKRAVGVRFEFGKLD